MGPKNLRVLPGGREGWASDGPLQGEEWSQVKTRVDKYQEERQIWGRHKGGGKGLVQERGQFFDLKKPLSRTFCAQGLDCAGRAAMNKAGPGPALQELTFS